MPHGAFGSISIGGDIVGCADVGEEVISVEEPTGVDVIVDVSEAIDVGKAADVEREVLASVLERVLESVAEVTTERVIGGG